jgi:hypothetical protein
VKGDVLDADLVLVKGAGRPLDTRLRLEQLEFRQPVPDERDLVRRRSHPPDHRESEFRVERDRSLQVSDGDRDVINVANHGG